MAISKQKITEYLLLLIIVIVVFFTPNVYAYLKINFFTQTIDMQEIAEIAIDSPKEFSIYNYNDKIVIATPDALSLYTADGKMLKRRQLNGEEVEVKVAGDIVLTAETLRGDVGVLSGDDLAVVMEKKDLGAISDILVSQQGYIVIVLEKDNRFYILNKQLEIDSSFALPEGEITNLSLSNDGGVLLVAVVNLENGRFKSYVYQYDLALGGKIIGSCDLADSLVFSVYMNDNQVVITDSEIKSYNRKSDEIATISDINKIDQSASYGEYLYTAFWGMSEETITRVDKNGKEVQQKVEKEVPKLKVYKDDFQAKASMEVKLKSLPQQIIVNDKFIATYAEGAIHLYDKEINSLAVNRSKSDLKGILWLGADKLLAYDNNLIRVYQLK